MNITFFILGVLNGLVGSNRTVLFNLFRRYEEWLDVLTADGNAEEAKSMATYAIEKGVKGVVIDGLTPKAVSHYSL